MNWMRSWGDPSFFIGSIDEKMNGLFKIPPEFVQNSVFWGCFSEITVMMGQMKGDWTCPNETILFCGEGEDPWYSWISNPILVVEYLEKLALHISYISIVLLKCFNWLFEDLLVSKCFNTWPWGWHEVLHQVCSVWATPAWDGTSAGRWAKNCGYNVDLSRTWTQAIFKLALDILPKGASGPLPLFVSRFWGGKNQ